VFFCVSSFQELAQYVTSFEHFEREGEKIKAAVRSWKKMVLGCFVGSIVLCLMIFGMVIGGIETLKVFSRFS